ncbi:MAG: hypothetical protein R2795_04020 [Saprospiraceae bacterium]
MGKASPLKTYYMFRNRWLLVKPIAAINNDWFLCSIYAGFGWRRNHAACMETRVAARTRGMAGTLLWHLGLGKE